MLLAVLMALVSYGRLMHTVGIRHRQLQLALDDEGSKAVKYTTVALLKLMQFDTITQRHII